MIDLTGLDAPEFSLQASDGKTYSLKDFANKKVILYFYPKDNTPGCTKEACAFRDLNKELKDKNLTVLGVSKDSLSSHNKFIENFSLPFLLLSDPDTKMMQTYGAWGEKTLYGKVSIGCIRSSVLIGEDGKVIKHWRRVGKAADHPAMVLKVLNNL